MGKVEGVRSGIQTANSKQCQVSELLSSKVISCWCHGNQ